MQTIKKIIISRIEDIHLKRIAEELKDNIADKPSEAALANLLPAETIYHDINLLHQPDHLTCILVMQSKDIDKDVFIAYIFL